MAKRNTESPKTPATGRSRTVERRKEKQQQQRRQQQTFIAIGLVAAVVIIGAIMVFTNLIPAEAPVPEGVAARYAGLEFSETVDGYPRVGNPDAPVEVVEYSSFACSACMTFHEDNFDNLIEYVRNGDINLTFVPITTTGSVPGAEGSTRAALCAGEQDYFWQFHDTLFSWQATFGNQAFQNNRLSTGAENLGLDMAAYNNCMGSGRPDEIIRAAQNEAEGFGSGFGTPKVLVDGTEVSNDWASIQQLIEQRLQFSGPRTQPTPVTTQEAVAPTEEASVTEEATEAVEATEEAAATEEVEATLEATTAP